jgi:hypothetical protein
MLEQNQRSLQHQTDPDFEQIVITDNEDRGYLWANSQIAKLTEKLQGQYVYILDDDDKLVCDTFIEDFKSLIINCKIRPMVVICKGYYIENKIFPKFWQTEPIRGQIGSPNFIVDKTVFHDRKHMWQQKRAGDYFFIKSCWDANPDWFFWWDQIIFKAD